jgi:hypothetical protein
MMLRTLSFLSIIILTTSAYGQLKLEWLIDVSGSYHYQIAATAFTKKDKTIMFAYGGDVYHIVPNSLPVKTYTTSSWVQRVWFDESDLVCEEFCSIVRRDFLTGAIKSEYCINLFDTDPPTAFRFTAQSGEFYYAAQGSWLGKFNKVGTRLNRVQFGNGAMILGIALGGDRAFVNVGKGMVYDTTLNLVKNNCYMGWDNLAADVNSNCYHLFKQPGYSVVTKTDSALNQIWTTNIADTYFHRLFLKGDSLFVTGEMSDFAPTNTGPKSAYSILNPQTGQIIETEFLDLADDNQFDTEKIVEMESDGKNLYGSGVRTNEGHGIPFVFKLSENGSTGLAESEKLDPRIFSTADQIMVSSSVKMTSRIIVSDALGRKVYEANVIDPASSYSVSTIGWTSGLYFVDFVSKDTHFKKKLFVNGH